MRVNARQLEAFICTMRCGSVTGAAEMLNVSQPAISQLLKGFEAACGFSLFERKHGRIYPTSEAETLFTEADRMFTGMEKIGRVAEGIKDRNWGKLTIAAFPAMASRFLPRAVTEYCNTRPDIRVTVESRRSRSLIDWVAANNVDIGIGLLSGEHPGVTSEELFRMSGVCAVPRKHHLSKLKSVHARDLVREPFISLGRDDRSRFGVDKVFDNLGITRRIQIETEQSEAACAFVAYGAGVSVVDPFSTYEFDEREIAVLPFKPRVEFRLWALFPSSRPPSRLARDFLATFKSSLERLEQNTITPRTPLP